MGFLNYTKKAVSRAANFVKGLFSKTRNTVTGLFKGKSKRSRSSSRKNVVQAEKMPANTPEQVASASSTPPPLTPPAPPAPPPSPVNTPGPVPPQAAGKKMRSKNLRGMKFYKPSRKATRRRSKTLRRRL
jgi:hypothetical protein